MPPDASIPAQVLDLIRADALAVGSHLPAQALADRLRVSRTPVNEALGVLSTKGVLRREPNRGYFLAQTVDEPAEALLARFGLAADNPAADAYFQIAEDRLQGRLPERVFPATRCRDCASWQRRSFSGLHRIRRYQKSDDGFQRQDFSRLAPRRGGRPGQGDDFRGHAGPGNPH